jgi:hypothetical protein
LRLLGFPHRDLTAGAVHAVLLLLMCRTLLCFR